MRSRYSVQRIDETRSPEDEDSTSDLWPPVEADLSTALDALESNCWDNIDEQRDCIICYPADYNQNIRTGDYEGFQIIIKGKERHLEWLMKVYHAKMAAEQQKWNERNQVQYTGDA